MLKVSLAMGRIPRAAAAGVLGLVMVGGASPASAQTGPGLMITPWPENRQITARTFMTRTTGHVRESDESLRLLQIDVSARYRFNAEADHSPAVGADMNFMRFRTEDPAVPNRMLDLSVAAGVPLASANVVGEYDTGFAATLGGGFAGDRPFADPRAWYGKASLLAVTELGPGRSLTLGLDYDGNRSIFPDLPLPGGTYTHRVSRELSYYLGVPASGLRYRPVEQLEINLDYIVPLDGEAELVWHVAPMLSLYGSYRQQVTAFHRYNDPRHRRHFFRQRRGEAGVRWHLTDASSLVLGAGYAFDQRLSRGFDVRSDDRVRRFSDEPYLRIALRMRY